MSFESRSRLHQVQCPSLIIHAALDYVTSPTYTKPIEDTIPGAEGFLMPDVAHVVAGKEQKARFCEALFGFLSRH